MTHTDGPAEWYPRECAYCWWNAALACRDTACRAAGHGEHRLWCPANHGSLDGCTCLGQVQPQ